MAQNIVAVKDLDLASKNYTIQVMVIEKDVPKLTSKKNIPCQRLMLQDVEGTKIQATIFANNITALEDTLKLYHKYSIINPTVNKTPEDLQFLDHPYQLVINKRVPVEEIQIPGITVNSIKYDFTEINQLERFKNTEQNLDVIFAVMEIGNHQIVNDTAVVEVQIVDQSMRPIILSIWDRFTEYELKQMDQPRGTFPVILGLRLRASAYQGLSLKTRSISAFVFDSPLQEAIALQLWCDQNADKLKELPSIDVMREESKALAAPQADEITSIANLPVTISRPEIFNIQGTIQTTDRSQNFCYVACSICKRAINAYGDAPVWCNGCKKKVDLQPRLRFNVTVSDDTGSKEATMFADGAEAIYQISDADIDLSQLTLTMAALERLAQPKTCIVALKARMQTYKDVTELKYTIQGILDSEDNPSQELLDIEPSAEAEQKDKQVMTAVESPITPMKRTPKKRKYGGSVSSQHLE